MTYANKSLIETLLPDLKISYYAGVRTATLADLEAALKDLIDRSVTVYGRHGDEQRSWITTHSSNSDTHTGKLIMVEEIKKESAEDILKSVVVAFEDGTSVDIRLKSITKARKYFEGKR